MDRVYLDYNATTPLDPRVLDAMLPHLREGYGNPSSLHWFGQQARAAVDQARAEIADLVGAAPGDVVLTASGTEADNLALRGVAAAARVPRRRILYSAIEHHAVVNTAKALGEGGVPVEIIRSRSDGRIDLDDLESKLDDTVALVSIMLANNETGLIQPVAEAAVLAHRHGALLHCDAVQAAGKTPVDMGGLGADLLSLSAHKIYGPKGAGALVVKRGTRMKPLLRGGSQEKNRRAGTENVPAIVGMGRAARLAVEEMVTGAPRETALRDDLERRLLALAGARRNGDGERVPNTTNVSFEGIDAESLIMALDLMGIAVSSGAACAAGAVEPSHVLRAMGLPMERVQGSVRFSLGRNTTAADVEQVATAVAEAVSRQRLRNPATTRG
jgi:cysteine desulfurase